MTVATENSKVDPNSRVPMLAAGMLLQDRALLAPMLCILAAPVIAGSLLSARYPSAAIAAQIIGRVIEIVMLYLVGANWVKRLAIEKRPISLRPVLPAVGLGMLLWFSIMLPLALQFSSLADSSKLLLLLLVIFGIVFNLKYFFFFAPFIFGMRLRGSTTFIASFTAQSLLPSLKVLFAPAAVSFLLANIVQGASPDERSALVNTLAAASGEIFWLLVMYLALAHVFITTPDPMWRDSGLDPYRESRLGTLEVTSPTFLRRMLTPRKALSIFVFGALVWAGNFLRVTEMPPAASISVKAITLHQKEVSILITADDPDYKFRGFRPIFFSLASENRSYLARMPREVKSPGGNEDMRLGLTAPGHVTLELLFDTDRAAEDNTRLEDLSLWYRNAKVAKLDMKGATVRP